MKIRLTYIGLIFMLLLVTACDRSLNAKPAAQTAVSSNPQPPTPSAVASSTNTPTVKALPTTPRPAKATNTPKPEIQWTDALPMTVLDGINGVWSPKEHAFLYQSNSNELYLAAGPTFQPTSFMPGQRFEDYTWSPDGQKVLFIGMEDPPSQVNIFSMDANGANPHVLNPAVSTSRYLWIKGWLDQENLIFADYSGGGHLNIEVIDIKTGGLERWGAFIHGVVFPPRNGYIPATTTLVPDIHQLLVISEEFQKSTLEEDVFIGGNIKPLPLYRSIPRQNTTSVFHDWRPNSSQMLVSWQQVDRQTWGFFDPNLLLWDVETDGLQLIAPEGIGGMFSPDGNNLAYLTNGPALVDANHTPMKNDRETTETQDTYLQLLEMHTGTVQLSIPILTDNGIDLLGLQGYITMKAQFSPNGRYLAFLSPGKIQLNAEGWPASTDDTAARNPTINLLDLQEKKQIWSSAANEEAQFSWSPASSLLVYQDEVTNWRLLNLEDLQETPVTETNGEFVDQPGWSYNGQYLSLTACLPLSENTRKRTINIFDVAIVSE